MRSLESERMKIIGREKIPKLPIQLSDPKFRKVLDHWHQIPAVHEIPTSMPTKLVKQEIRSAILDTLREGIMEYDEQNDRVHTRHVFSAKELQKIIGKRVSIKIKISNVYFHLNKLKDKGLIEIVESIKEGRQITHYFGRTARLFLWIGDLDDVKEKFKPFHFLLEQFNPDLESDAIQELFSSVMRTQSETHDRVKRWMEKHEDMIMRSNIDTRDLYVFLKSIDNCNRTTIEFYKKITDLLNFPTE
ncbi:MAG: winged helix-turn-helix transcriptional regulator [Candidatus Heimdallarchaeota archaeon]|nr:MAG: winged helix-turn-helix transcriptional regulator [Candidatus Heimdallarchaeota archaeon]